MKTTASRASAVSQTRGFGDLLYDKAGSRPSLDLDFAGKSSLRDKITGEYLVDHTRGSSGTFINSEGLIETSHFNQLAGSEALDETATYPLNLQNTSIFEDNTDGVYTPRGKLSRILKPNQTGTQPVNNTGQIMAPRFFWNNNLGQAGYTITKSIYAKMQPGGPRYLSHYGWAGNNISTIYVKFDLQEGVIHGNKQYYPDNQTSRDRTTCGIIDVGGGWYRLFVTIQNTSQHPSVIWTMTNHGDTSVLEDFYYDSSTFDVNKGIYIAHPQLNLGQLKDYIPTPASVRNFAPRFTHERVETGNLLLNSERFISSDWDKGTGGVTVNQNYALSPDNKFSATRLNLAASSTTWIKQDINLVNGKTYTFSVYVKDAGNSSHFDLYIYKANVIAQRLGKTAAPSEWSRYSVTFTATANGAFQCGIDNENDSFTTDVLIWGAQLNEGSSADTYVPSIDTFTSRASSATYVDSAGLIKTAALNYILNSDSPSHHTHTTQGIHTFLSYGSTAPTTDGPFGTNQLVKKVVVSDNKPDFVPSGSGDTLTSDQKIRFGASEGGGGISAGIPNQTFTWSFYYRSLSGDRRISIATGGDIAYNRVQLTATSEWQRAEVSGTRSDSLLILDIFYLFNGGADLEFTAFQAEKGNKASDYVQNAYSGSNNPTGVNTSAQARYSHDPETLTPTGLYLEPAATNVIHNNTAFNTAGSGQSGWFIGSSGDTVVANSGTAPDGTQTADKFVAGNSSSDLHAVYQTKAFTDGDGTILSAYVKAAGLNYVNLISQAGGATNARGVQFDLTNGTVKASQNATGEIINVGNGWYRIIVKPTTTNSQTYFVIIPNTGTTPSTNNYFRPTFTGNNSDGILVWGAQQEAGSFATSLIFNEGQSDVTRAADVYTSTANLTETFEPRGLLIEEARTTVATYSNIVGKYADWSKTGLTVQSPSSPTYTTPMGTTSDLREMVENTQTNNHFHYHSSVALGTAAKCVTVFVKPLRTDRNIQTRAVAIGGNAPWVTFDLNAGIVAYHSGLSGTSTGNIAWSMGTPLIEKHANGWYRIGFTNCAIASSSWHLGLYVVRKNINTEGDSFTGDNVASFSCWGLQYENGEFPTSYIHNEGGSNVTRSADVASISGDNFGTYRTNLLTRTEHLWDSSSYFVLNSATNNADSISKVLTPYAYPNPIDGRYNAALIHRQSTDYQYIQQSISAPVITGFSIYVKPVSNPCIVQLFTQSSQHGRANFDLINKTHGGDGTRNITEVGDGWLRLEWITLTHVNNPSSVQISLCSDSLTTARSLGTGTNVKFYAYAPQIEDNSITNYIPSTDTFTSRLGNATYVDSNGLIKTAYRNYIKNTDFAANWAVVNLTKSTQEVLNPFGTTEYVIETNQNAGGQAIIYQNTNNQATGVVSVYAKASTKDKVSLIAQEGNSANSRAASFDLSNGTVQATLNNATASIEDVGNGWYRLSVSGGGFVNFLVINPHDQESPSFSVSGRVSSSSASGGIFLFGPQLVDSTTESGDFTHNLSSTQSGAPRYSHDVETLVPTGLYLEPAATNHQMVSPTLTISGVTQNGVANVVNHVLPSDYDYYGTSSVLYSQDVTAPDGTDTTLKVAFSGLQNNVNHNYLKIGKATGTLNAGTYTFSFFIKSDNANVRDYIGPDFDGRAGGIGQQTAQANPWVSGHNSPLNWKLIDYPNGWIRAYVNFTLSSTITNIWNSGIYWLLAGGNNQTALNYKTFYLWGFQLEAGSYPSSFIGSSVASAATTRPADTYTSTATTVLDRDGGNKEAFFTPTSGNSSFVIGSNQLTSSLYPRIFSMGQGNTEGWYLYFNNPSAGRLNNELQPQGIATQLTTSTNSIASGEIFKAGSYIHPDSTKVFLNGTEGSARTSVTLFNPPESNDNRTPTAMTISNRASAGRKYVGTINRLTFWKTRLPDASLINITNT